MAKRAPKSEPTTQHRKFKIQRSKKARKGFADLPPAKQKTVERIVKEYLAVSPLERVPGKTKVLHGQHKGILQYDIDDSHRIHYTVDKEKAIVYVDYIGPHPDW